MKKFLMTHREVIDITRDAELQQLVTFDARAANGRNVAYTLGKNTRLNLREGAAALDVLVRLVQLASEPHVAFQPTVVIARGAGFNDLQNVLVLDLDPTDKCPEAQGDLQLLDHVNLVIGSIVEKLQQLVVHAEHCDFTYVVAADAPADKHHRGSFHVFFTNLPVSSVPDAVYTALQKVIDEITDNYWKVDGSIDNSGISFGPSCKWIAKEGRYRASHKRPIVMGSTDTELQEQFERCPWLFCTGKAPGHATSPVQWTVVDPLPRAAPARTATRAAVDFDAMPDEEPDDALLSDEENKTARTVFDYYKRVMDPGARVRVKVRDNRRVLRLDFRDSAACRCKHASNNHYAYVDSARNYVAIHCGGPNGRRVVYTLTEIATYSPMEVTSDNADVVSDNVVDFVTWVRSALHETNVSVPCTRDDALQHMLPDAAHFYEPPDGVPGALLFSAAMLNAVVDTTGDPAVAFKIMNLMVTYVGADKIFMYRDGRGHHSFASDSQLALMMRGYRIKGAKRDKPMWKEYLTWPLRASVAEFEYRRLVWTGGANGGTMPVLVPLRYPPLTGEVFSAQELRETHALLHAIVGNLVWDGLPALSTQYTREQFVAAQGEWVLDWMSETLMTSEPCGVILHFMDMHGGAGKSMFLELMTSLLGLHQYVYMMDSKQLHKSFNAHLPRMRLVCFDDAHNTDPNDLKNAATRKYLTYDVKFGANGVNAKLMSNHLVASNGMLSTNSQKGDSAMQRRIMTCLAAHNLHLLFNELPFIGRHFYSHIDAMAYCFELLADQQFCSRVSTVLAERFVRRERETGGLRDSLRRRIESGEVISFQFRNNTLDEQGVIGSWLMTRMQTLRELLPLHDLPDGMVTTYSVRRGMSMEPRMVPGLYENDESTLRPPALQYIDADTLQAVYERENGKIESSKFRAGVVAALNVIGNAGGHADRVITCETTVSRVIVYTSTSTPHWSSPAKALRRTMFVLEYTGLCQWLQQVRANERAEPAQKRARFAEDEMYL